MAQITIYSARKIHTMNPTNPEATHIAVRDGMILGCGPLAELTGWGPHELDDRFREHVIVPGFVEAHAHAFAGVGALLPYVGYFDRAQPDGSVAPGVKSYGELQQRLRALDAAMEDPAEPLVARGFDPIYFAGTEPRLTRHHLDEVSRTRPIFLHHASGHLATVNTAMLELDGVSNDVTVEGVGRDAEGNLDGELREPPAMALCRTGYRASMRANQAPQTLWGFAANARNEGITTCTDLGGPLLMQPKTEERWQEATGHPDYPLRVAMYNIPAMGGSAKDFEDAAEAFMQLRERAHDRLRFPGVKFVLDGSIQGWSALINPPGYFTGEDHGQLLTVPDQFLDWFLPFHRRGINVHMHCNGTATQDLAIDTVERALRASSWLDHRHTITHAQLSTQAQLRRMAAMRIAANFFTNHLWFWGDQHYEQTVGPERAHGLEPCGSALREGVRFSMHSDAGVTPLGHLHTMWCAVNRVTPSGRVLGESEKISAAAALRAVTIDAAWMMHMDDEIGSLEAGKAADFAVLEEDPLAVDPMKIRDIGIWGTVLGGRPRPAGDSLPVAV